MQWLRRWWHARQRKVDLNILWPQIRIRATSLEQARKAFLMFAVHDESWKCLGEEGIYQEILKLR